MKNTTGRGRVRFDSMCMAERVAGYAVNHSGAFGQR